MIAVLLVTLLWPISVVAAPGDITGVVDTFTVEATSGFGRGPTMCEVSEGVIAITYSIVGDTAIRMKTVEIDEYGVFGEELDSYVVNSGTYSRWPIIVPHPDSSTTFAVFYQSPGYDLTVETVTITSGGQISYVDEYEITTSLKSTITCHHPVSVGGDTFAEIYIDDDSDGQLVTMDINSDGTIDPSPILDTWEYQLTYADDPIMDHVDGNIWAVYNREVNDTFLFTTSIGADGTLGKSKIDNHLVSDDTGGDMNLLEVRDGMWVLVGMMPTGTHRGIQTFTISNDGTTITLEDTRDILDDFDGGETPFISYNFANTLLIEDGIFAIFWRANTSDGWVRTYPVDVDGVIGTFNGTGRPYQLDYVDTGDCFWMYHSVLNPSEGLYLAAWGDNNVTPSGGFIRSIDMGIPEPPSEPVYMLAGVLPYIFVGIALLAVLAFVGTELSVGAIILGGIGFVIAAVGASLIYELTQG